MKNHGSIAVAFFPLPLCDPTPLWVLRGLVGAWLEPWWFFGVGLEGGWGFCVEPVSVLV